MTDEPSDLVVIAWASRHKDLCSRPFVVVALVTSRTAAGQVNADWMIHAWISQHIGTPCRVVVSVVVVVAA